MSLALSVLTLWLIARFLERTELVHSAAAKRHALAIVAFLPQFVLFGLYITNDALAIAVGAWITLAALRYIEMPRRGALLWLATSAGVGLLTKGTFLAAVPVVFAVVLWVERRLAPLVLAGLIMGLIGGYKYAENYVHLGRPIVHNIDFRPPWAVVQMGRETFRVDVLALARQPYAPEPTHQSVPGMLYATTWYSYIPESNLTATRAHPWLARLLLFAGAVPTLLVAYGLVTVRRRPPELALVGLLGMTLALVLSAGLKYQVWSCFQGRLLFPAMLSIVCALAWGFGALRRDLRRLAGISLLVLHGAFSLYYAIEISHALPIQMAHLRRVIERLR